MLKRPEVVDVVAEMLQGAAPDPAEIQHRIERAIDPGYWRALSGELTVDTSTESEPRPAVDIAPLVKRVQTDGYFVLNDALSRKALAPMFEVVESLHRAGWHPVFAFVYDQFWSAWRVPALMNLMAGVLGANFRHIPRVWCHYVARIDGARGWAPHIDDTVGRRKMTAWIPLSDATLENGCIYIVPKNRGPRDVVERWDSLDTIPARDVRSLLHAVRALPVPSGSIAGWDMSVLHWGSMSSEAVAPRVALSLEFLADDVEPLPNERPPLPRDRMPGFVDRLIYIARNLCEYERYEPQLVRHGDLPHRLLARLTKM